MTSLAILIILCTLALSSLLAVSIVNQRQQKAKLVRQKLNHLKLKVEDLEALVIDLDQLVENRAIPKIVNDEIIEILQAMLSLDNGARYLEATLRNAENRSVELADAAAERDISRLRDSDAQIARTQYKLNEAGRVLRHRHAQGHITAPELETFISDLSWAHLLVDVISHIGQGHKAVNRGDPSTAHAYYKKAQSSLIQSPHSDNRRHRMIKELGEIMQGRRKSLSTDLMPETYYNPQETTEPSNPDL